jgi:SNF2 family DNA or RNA helicase
MKFDVILTSYGFVMNQYRKMCQYVNRVEEFKQNGQSIRPLERPSLSIFSEIFYQQYTESNLKFPYLILDEVTAIKNCDSITFGALRELRMLADACVMLTGSVVDNTWFDLFAFIRLVLSHTIDKRSTMISLFASRNAADKIIPPRDTQFCRLIQLLNSFVVRRPEITIDIPELVQEDVTFELSDDEASQSNHNFDKYQRIMRMNSKDAVQIPGQSKKLQPWKYLTRALQHACHPRMVDIMHFARNQFATNDDEADADRLYEAEDIEKWLAWREELTKDDNWKSSRVTAIIDTFNKQRDLDPFCAGLIFDESVYFLDIVQIAFSQMYDPVECLRYDGRETPEKRILILQEFEKAAGKKVLLISRGAGGVGLNITAANVVILCSPWWKVGWEKQAIKRAHRTGQKRKVWAGRVVAANCDMDLYKARTRDKKNRHNAKIMDRITRKDGEMPRIWNDFV